MYSPKLAHGGARRPARGAAVLGHSAPCARYRSLSLRQAHHWRRITSSGSRACPARVQVCRAAAGRRHRRGAGVSSARAARRLPLLARTARGVDAVTDAPGAAYFASGWNSVEGTQPSLPSRHSLSHRPSFSPARDERHPRVRSALLRLRLPPRTSCPAWPWSRLLALPPGGGVESHAFDLRRAG